MHLVGEQNDRLRGRTLIGRRGKALVPERMLERTLEIKKSRFIARAAPASTREQALSVLDAARAAYPDARHHCWAYLLGTPASASAAMSDDGEPGGTARSEEHTSELQSRGHLVCRLL